MKWFFDLIMPFLKWIAEKRFTWHDPIITLDWIDQANKVIYPGDVLLSVEDGAFTNLINWGMWKHAAMYIGDNEVIEATHLGVKINRFDIFCSNKDKICILRPKFCDMIEECKACDIARSMLGESYDYEFSIRNKAKYCVEVPIQSYQKLCPSYSPVTTKVMGQTFYAPDDLWKDHKNWSLVLNSMDYYKKA